MKIVKKKSTENCHFYSREKSLYMYIAWACFRNNNCRGLLKDLVSRGMRIPTFCLCENKGADKLRGHFAAGERLCLRYIDGAIYLLPNPKFSLNRWFVRPFWKPQRKVLSRRGFNSTIV